MHVYFRLLMVILSIVQLHVSVIGKVKYNCRMYRLVVEVTCRTVNVRSLPISSHTIA